MPFNGSGSFSPPGADFPAVANTLIEATKFNNVINDIATGLSTCITKDGQTTVTANIPFSGNRLTGIGAPTATGDALREGSAIGATTPAAVTSKLGTGTATMPVSGAINTQTDSSGVGNGADATDDTLFTYSLPLNSLVTNGQSVNARAWGLCANNANNKTVKMFFAGLPILVSTTAAHQNLQWSASILVTRIDETHVSCECLINFSGESPTVNTIVNQVVADLTANASIIKVTGASATSTANDVLGYGMKIIGFT